MATSSLKNPFVPIVKNFYSTSSWTSNRTVSVDRCIRVGNIVHIQLLIEFNSGSEVGTSTFAKVYDDFKPSQDRTIPVILMKSNSIVLATGVVSSLGNVFQGWTSSGVQKVWIDSTYEI